MNVPRIRQLDPLVSNQIAAGEVIERPASIIKELVENALDAKATHIDIDIEGAGVHLIRVRDNGVGIQKADLGLALSRHATSKIQCSDDLFAIQSLGFRGEALASIAAVSRCRIISRAQGSDQAWQLDNICERAELIVPAAHDRGTTVEVADLFYNVPVRRKFLRSAKTEFQAMDEMLKRLALSHPLVRFKLTHQQRLIRHFPAVSAMLREDSRVAKICGQHFMDSALNIHLQSGDLSLKGWIGLPESAHRQADCQYFFINQRMVKDRFIHQIIKTLFQQNPGFLEGTYPCYVLYLSIDPTQIDVNVHPTKQEVRFHQPRWIHDFISKAVSDLLAAAQGTLRQVSAAPVMMPLLSSSISSPDIPVATLPTGRRYALLEKSDQVVVVDLQRAKICLVTRYLQQLQGVMPTKTLLFPKNITLLAPVGDLSVIQTTLQSWGFVIQRQAHQWMLLQQPKVMEAVTDALLQKLIRHCFHNDDSQTVASLLAEEISLTCLYDLTVRQFDALLAECMEAIPEDSYITHEVSLNIAVT